MKCWICGNNVDKVYICDYSEYDKLVKDPLGISKGVQRHYCKKCLAEHSEQYKKDMNEYIRLKKKLMFERALRILENQPLDIYEYQEAIRAVEVFAREKPDKFDSAYEMVAAIILVDNEIECELQYKVGKYQCDFYIPSMKVVLEVDGDRHKHKVAYDSIRDEAILKELGHGWNIVRIKTEYLDQKAELLVEAIKTTVEKRYETKRNRKSF